MNINQLDNLCFVHIFANFTLTELYRLSTVCKQWKLIVGFCVYTLKLQIILPPVANESTANEIKIPVCSEQKLQSEIVSNAEHFPIEKPNPGAELLHGEEEKEVELGKVEEIDLYETSDYDIAWRKSHFETIFEEHLINLDDGTPVHRDTSQLDTIKLTGYDLNSITRLVETFPRITKLEVYGRGDFTAGSHLASLITLVESYYASLSSLELCITVVNSDKYHFPRSHSDRLLACINRMFRLQSLTIDIDLYWFKHSKTGPPHCQPQLVLPIIGQLKEFNFASPDTTLILRDSLQKYASSNENLLKIGYCFSDCRDKNEYLHELSRKLSPQLCARFYICTNEYEDISDHEMPFSFTSIPITKLSPFVEQFSSLTTLSIELDEQKMSLYESFSRLVHLRQLTVLHIKCVAHLFQIFQPSTRSLPQLVSVKVLNVNLIYGPHTYMARLNAPWTFPNVQVVTLRRAGPYCDCDPRRECEIKFALLVKDCQHLRALFINDCPVSIERLFLLAQRMVADDEE